MLTRLLFAAARRIAPHGRRDWIDAIHAECLCASGPDSRGRFASACIRTAVELRWRDSDKGALTLGLVLVALVAALEWATDEPTVVLAGLLAAAFVGGFVQPRHWLGIGLAVGLAVAASHLLLDLTRLSVPRYEHAAPSPGDFLVMLFLPLPALLAALAGRLGKRWMTGP